MNNWYKISQKKLLQELESLKDSMASYAQFLYDNWEQNEEGLDEELGSGGICDQISEVIGNVIYENIENVDVLEGGQPGDDHAWVIVHRGNEAYSIDIPHCYYEIGSGYSWDKVPDVKFTPDMVEIIPIDNYYLE